MYCSVQFNSIHYFRPQQFISLSLFLLELDFELELEFTLGANNRHRCKTTVAWFIDYCFGCVHIIFLKIYKVLSKHLVYNLILMLISKKKQRNKVNKDQVIEKISCNDKRGSYIRRRTFFNPY